APGASIGADHGPVTLTTSLGVAGTIAMPLLWPGWAGGGLGASEMVMSTVAPGRSTAPLALTVRSAVTAANFSVSSLPLATLKLASSCVTGTLFPSAVVQAGTA